MAAGIFLVTRTVQGVNQDINGIREVIVHEDDGQSDAAIIIALLTNMNTVEQAGEPAGSQDQYPAGYFDTVLQIGATPVAALATDGDYLAYRPNVALLEA